MFDSRSNANPKANNVEGKLPKPPIQAGYDITGKYRPKKERPNKIESRDPKGEPLKLSKKADKELIEAVAAARKAGSTVECFQTKEGKVGFYVANKMRGVREYIMPGKDLKETKAKLQKMLKSVGAPSSEEVTIPPAPGTSRQEPQQIKLSRGIVVDLEKGLSPETLKKEYGVEFLDSNNKPYLVIDQDRHFMDLPSNYPILDNTAQIYVEKKGNDLQIHVLDKPDAQGKVHETLIAVKPGGEHKITR